MKLMTVRIAWERKDKKALLQKLQRPTFRSRNIHNTKMYQKIQKPNYPSAAPSPVTATGTRPEAKSLIGYNDHKFISIYIMYWW